jgi:hypothetical protein
MPTQQPSTLAHPFLNSAQALDLAPLGLDLASQISPFIFEASALGLEYRDGRFDRRLRGGLRVAE